MWHMVWGGANTFLMQVFWGGEAFFHGHRGGGEEIFSAKIISYYAPRNAAKYVTRVAEKVFGIDPSNIINCSCFYCTLHSKNFSISLGELISKSLYSHPTFHITNAQKFHSQVKSFI